MIAGRICLGDLGDKLLQLFAPHRADVHALLLQFGKGTPDP